MNKFIIENVIIEKSDKDISLGVGYEFSSGINLICGKNEAGKSSLMNFVKTGFFPEKGEDTGKIFFSWNDKQYRVDVNLKAASSQRCKLFDDNAQIDFNFIQSNIVKRDLEEGFFISLDDLMNIQSKNVETLIDLIKDSSSKKLEEEINKTREAVKKVYGEKNRLTNKITKILEGIEKQNHEINELSNNESHYNSAINSINALNEELLEISKKEEYIKTSFKIKEITENLSSAKDKYQYLAINYNEKLLLNRESCLDLIYNANNVQHYESMMNENLNKLTDLNSKINSNILNLNREFLVNFSNEDLLNFEIDFLKIKKIKDQLQELEDLEKKLYEISVKKENIEDSVSNLEKQLSEFEKKIENIDNSKNLNDLYSFIDNELKQYNFLKNEIAEKDKNIKINKGGIITNKKLLILLGSLFVFNMVGAVFGFCQKVPILGILSVVMAIFSVVGFISLKLASKDDEKIAEIERMVQHQNAILENLRLKLTEYYPELGNVENSYLIIKITELMQEIYKKTQEMSYLNDSILDNNNLRNSNLDKLKVLNENLKEIESKKQDILENNKKLMHNSCVDIEMQAKQYLELIELIKIIKDELTEKQSIEKSNIEISAKKDEIISKFKNFIIENEIDIPFSLDFSENIEQLKRYDEKNNKIKQELELANADIRKIEKDIENLQIELQQFPFENVPSEMDLNELSVLKEEKLKQREDFLGVKKYLERVEGLEELKIKKNSLIDEYNKEIENLIKNKVLLLLCETAKRNFDKNQPDLQNAQKYLSILTDGKYTKINLELKEIQNEDCTKIKEWKNLSRGTKELLYFALRLGFASNYSKDKVTFCSNGKPDLPMIIDDAFVNFDSDRVKNAIKCLVEFSKTNQVLFFTCHSDVMKKYFEELCSDYKVINL